MPLDEKLKFRRFITSSDLPCKVGPDGKKLCAWCDGKLGKGRRRYCSDACSDEFVIRASSTWASHHVYQRDKGICAVCKINTNVVDNEWSLLRHSPVVQVCYRTDMPVTYRNRDSRETITKDEFDAKTAESEAAKQAFAEKYPWAYRVKVTIWGNGHLWEADHIIPVSEGGGACGLDNYRTLCRACHNVETGKLRKRLNKTKKPVIQLTIGDTKEGIL